MKNQINILNIAGAIVSVSLMVSLFFLPSLASFSLRKRRSGSKTSKAQIQPTKCEKTPGQTTVLKEQKQELKSIEQPQPIKQTTVPKMQKQKPEAPKQMVEIKAPKQEIDSIQVAEKPQQMPPKSNGCPKNLEYYTMKPRPKQTPEECMTCKNLIDCVCLTSD